jgi:hypothetical protein
MKARINNWLEIHKCSATWTRLRKLPVPANAFGEALLIEAMFSRSDVLLSIANEQLLAISYARLAEGTEIGEWLMTHPISWEELESE